MDFQTGRDDPYPLSSGFRRKYLGQKPLSARELIESAEIFVHQIGWEDENIPSPKTEGNGYGPLFNRLQAMCDRRFPLLLQIMAFLCEGRGVGEQWRLRLKQGACIYFPYYESKAMGEVAKLILGSKIKSEYCTRGMQSLYCLIAPVYDYFHQLNTQLVPILERGKFRQLLGCSPISILSPEYFREDTKYYSNDAAGRDRVLGKIIDFIRECRCGKEEGSSKEKLRILLVGDGPAMIAAKILEAGHDSPWIYGIQIYIADFNCRQIESGRRAYEDLLQQNDRLQLYLRKREVSIHWLQADAAQLPFEDKQFDLVASSYMVGALFNRRMVEDYAREGMRLLRPGGRRLDLDFNVGNDRWGYVKGLFPRHSGWGQPGAIAAALLMGSLTRASLRNCYRIWGHKVSHSGVLLRCMRNLPRPLRPRSIHTEHRQTWFGHFPLWTWKTKIIALSLPGYKEIIIEARK